MAGVTLTLNGTGGNTITGDLGPHWTQFPLSGSATFVACGVSATPSIAFGVMPWANPTLTWCFASSPVLLTSGPWNGYWQYTTPNGLLYSMAAPSLTDVQTSFDATRPMITPEQGQSLAVYNTLMPVNQYVIHAENGIQPAPFWWGQTTGCVAFRIQDSNNFWYAGWRPTPITAPIGPPPISLMSYATFTWTFVVGKFVGGVETVIYSGSSSAAIRSTPTQVVLGSFNSVGVLIGTALTTINDTDLGTARGVGFYFVSPSLPDNYIRYDIAWANGATYYDGVGNTSGGCSWLGSLIQTSAYTWLNPPSSLRRKGVHHVHSAMNGNPIVSEPASLYTFANQAISAIALAGITGTYPNYTVNINANGSFVNGGTIIINDGIGDSLIGTITSQSTPTSGVTALVISSTGLIVTGTIASISTGTQVLFSSSGGVPWYEDITGILMPIGTGDTVLDIGDMTIKIGN